MSQPAAYLDSSAFVKLVEVEPESRALRKFLRAWPVRVSSSLLITEATRAAARKTPGLVNGVRTRLRRIQLIPINDELLTAAAAVQLNDVRTLDAIHIASALVLGEDLGVVVTYDDRMKKACLALELKTAAPG